MTQTGVTMTVEEIPKGWRKEKIKEFAKVITGNTPPTSALDSYNGSYLWVTPTDINEKKDINNTNRKLTEKGINLARRLPPETLLITCIASIGKNAILKKEGSCNQQINAILPSEKYNTDFLYYWFENNKKLMLLLAGQTAVPIINKNTFENLSVVLPSLKEQKKISDILLTVEASIDTTSETIQSCANLKRGLRQLLFTKGLPGKHKKFKKTELGEIPESWKIESLVNVSTILLCNVDKKSHSDEKSVKLCNYIDVYKNRYITNKLDFMKATATDNEIVKFGIKIGDVLITKDSETPNDIAVSSVVIEHIDNLVCGYHLALIRPKSDKLDSLFLMNLFSNKLIKNTIARKANGLTRFSLGQKTIQEIPILVPPLDEQKKIAQILTDLDERVQSEKTKKQQLIKLKLSLMQKLLSGEIRVRV